MFNDFVEEILSDDRPVYSVSFNLNGTCSALFEPSQCSPNALDPSEIFEVAEFASAVFSETQRFKRFILTDGQVKMPLREASATPVRLSNALH